jgi:surfactin family lipopeptide synthetase A
MQQYLEELLLKLKKLNVGIKADGENLKVTVPKGFNNPDIISALKENKDLIIDYLKNVKDLNSTMDEIPKAVEKEYYPLTSPQLRLFLLNQINKSSLAYNQTGVLKIKGQVDQVKLINAFKALVERHEGFRMSFNIDHQSNQPVLKVKPNICFEIENLKIESDIEALIHQFIRPFNLSNPPLIRAGLASDNDIHYVLMDMHHIISDGVSLQIIMKELSQLYEGNILPALKRQYKDYSMWVSGNEYQDLLQCQKKFWLRLFDIDYNPLELPYDFKRPKEKTYKGRVAKFVVSNEEKNALYEIGRKYNITLYSILLGIYGLLLSKLSGKSDIVVGTLVASRKHNDLEGIVGMFAQTLALPISLNNESSFKNFIQELHKKVLNCIDNDAYPYEELINDLNIERDHSRNPLTDCLFVLQNSRPESFEIKGADIQKYPIESKTAKFDLTLEASENASGLSFDLEYSTDLFTEDTIKRFITFYKVLLNQVIENQEILLSELSLLSKSDENNIAKHNNRTCIAYPKNVTVVELFESQVKKTPDAIAVVCEEESLTYSELNNLSNILAYELRSRGIGRDDIVGLFMDKNLYTVVGMLGILKAGGCYLPLDPDYPESRINYMIENSQLKTLVTYTKHENNITNTINTVVLENIFAIVNEVTDIESINQPNDLCYIIYTSGTTGNPKGVMIEHRNIVRLFFNDAFQFDFGDKDVWTMFHSHCFDFSVWEMYGALLFGGKVIIIPQSIAQDPTKYLQLLSQYQVTVLNQTPTAFNNLMDEVARNDIRLSALRYVIFGGEALIPEKLQSWQQKYPKVTLVNMYGITEVTVHASYKEIGEQEITDNISNIGVPIPTTSLYILDKNKKLLPKGIIGEIYVGGAGISRGYLNNKALTEKYFFDNPYQKGERLYRSGDLGRILDNGELEYLGRIDDQVQLKGFRIELKEIEHHLLNYESISGALVIKQDTGDGYPYLCAYYTGTKKLDVSVLRTHLGNYLPNYMIPSYFVKLDVFPTTANNKIAITKLPVPNKEEQGGSYFAPQTKEESIMAQIWEDVLGVKQVGIRENYFNLGGDSLKAIGLISQTNKQMHTSLTIADLYTYQTIEELAVAVTNLEQNNSHTQNLEAARKELKLFQENYRREGKFLDTYETVYPMNGVEKGMVFHSLKVNPNNIHEIIYHEQNIYDCIAKDFNNGLFMHALHMMIEKHPTLRKVYDLDSMTHIVLKRATPEVNFIDICHLSKEEQKIYIEKKMLEEKMKMTNLSFSLLWRINILKTSTDFQYLLFDFHHSLFDGWSLSSFLTELLNIYTFLNKDNKFIPTPLQSSYEDQIVGELAASRDESSIQFWKEELDGYIRFELPSTGDKHTYNSNVFDMGTVFRDKLESLAAQHNTSFKHLCFAAYIYTLYMLSYEDDITIGMVTNNRPLTADGDRLLGCFLNTIPFRVKIPENITWRGYIEFIENKLRKLKYHERIPFYKILEIIGEVSSEKNPIFDVSFNYIDFRIYSEIQEMNPIIRPEEFQASNFYMNNNMGIDFHIFADNGIFRLALTHSTAVISKAQIEKLAHYFKAILEQFLYNKEAFISKEAIMDDDALLNEYNSTVTEYEHSVTILDLFSMQVGASPEKTAVVFEGRKLCYKELDEITNQLSHILIEKGVEVDTLVPICIDRSLEMIIGILGILKAGGAYVPIDPNYPQNRIDYILQDTKAKFVLTEHKYQDLFTNFTYLNLDDQSIYKERSNCTANTTISGDNLAYVIFTSGTTGTPKGVMIQHDGLYNRLMWMQNYLGVTETDIILQKTTYCFDVSVWELLLPLTTGAKLAFAAPEGHKDPTYLWNIIRNEQISILHFVPSMLSVFLSNFNSPENCDLRTVICSGEELKTNVVKNFQAIFPYTRLYNLYGPTEATIDVTAIDLTSYQEGVVSIGKPISNTQIYIVDNKNNIQPAGVIGELLIGGIQVARGYLNKPELSSQRFINNPYDKNDKYKLYKTGDIGCWLPDGNIQLLGRLDDQIKIRGFRIETREIQNQLLNHPEITDSIVLAVSYNENTELVAYYVSKVELSISELQQYLRSNLPEYMVPLRYQHMEEIPLTANGKADKSKLPLPEIHVGSKFLVPSNNLEEKLIEIWSDALDLDKEKISIDRSFFELGGNSLTAVYLVNKMNQAFDINISFPDFFNAHNIQGIAILISSLDKVQHIDNKFSLL